MTSLPDGAWDTHCHVFPQGFAPEPGKDLPPGPCGIEEYRDLARRLGVAHPVFVQANAYGLDNAALLDALATWGQEARGVAAVAPGTPEEKLQRLHNAGVRGARVMDLGGGAVPLARVAETAAMVCPLGWTTIVQFDGAHVLDHVEMLSRIPGDWILDHYGKFVSAPPTSAHLDAVKRLMDGGAHVKFSAAYEFSRAGAPDFWDVADIATELIAHRPDRILWGSNWPHILKPADAKPDDAAHLSTVLGWIDTRHHREIFVKTPQRLFGTV